MDIYDDYLYEVINEYKPDHKFVFVKLAGESPGTPMEYYNIYSAFQELKGKIGIHITPHMFRHSHGTLYYLET
ncbi:MULTISPECIES: tyrosine-type recombinase/integrase [Peribacillus]|uniref:tyrosine-type recombinase/integrase n=1 Tax=Peribacillus TaxID=2675229 RepID=UPI00203AD369|nr:MULTISPECIES: tyrosine-type recombinase/integrase [Peribacillus]MCM3675634.1 tyrosine-type recombinase/integrase [Peribacillus simplex]MDQ0880927.1 integrase [Peribacillus sp. V2I11]